jgi:hypothetical protein
VVVVVDVVGQGRHGSGLGKAGCSGQAAQAWNSSTTVHLIGSGQDGGNTEGGHIVGAGQNFSAGGGGQDGGGGHSIGAEHCWSAGLGVF